MSKVMKIKLGADGLGTLQFGNSTVGCGGKKGMNYPKDLTINTSDKKGTHISGEYDAEMPFAILIWGQRGVYIHQWPCLENSSGCLHLLEGDAKKVYDWVDGRTRVLIEYPW
eukprot:TRINITY_DN87428_c0_g1_i1.p1 TRINITY_DN87428_c0_g1~~TRINITY_DN87428_c0_g1_i1.p1  ORF type:complete len:112 (-),score=8.49 TRINITY_DN87428_c0_g1_i1:63-398(-)